MLLRRPLLSALPLALLSGACGSDPGVDTPEAESGTSAELHSARVDTAFPAVGWLSIGASNFCTATLIGPYTVVTAAHCMSPLPQGCTDSASLLNGMTFQMSRSGLHPLDTTSTADHISVNVVDVRVDPFAYSPRLADCDGGCNSSFGIAWGLHSGYDVAVLRLASNGGQVNFAKPVRVLTGLQDFQLAYYGDHGKIDGSVRFASGGQWARPTLVGCGSDDDGSWSRRAGTTWYEDGPNWGTGPAYGFTCGTAASTGALPYQPLLTVTRSGTFSADWSHSIYDGASVAPGDSGGPLMIHAGHAYGDIPELLAGEWYVTGVVSTGTDRTAAGKTVAPDVESMTNYAPTFAPWNAALIESALRDWNEPLTAPNVHAYLPDPVQVAWTPGPGLAPDAFEVHQVARCSAPPCVDIVHERLPGTARSYNIPGNYYGSLFQYYVCAMNGLDKVCSAPVNALPRLQICLTCLGL